MAKSLSVVQANRRTGGVTRCSTTMGNGETATEVLKLLQMTDDEVLQGDWNAVARKKKLKFPIPGKLQQMERLELELCRRSHKKHGTDLAIDRDSIRTVHSHAEHFAEAQPLLQPDEKDYLAADHIRSVIGQILSDAAEELGLITVGHTRKATPEELAKVQKVEAVIKKTHVLIETVLDSAELTVADTVVDIAEQAETALRMLLMQFNIVPFVGYNARQQPRRSGHGMGTIRNNYEGKVGRNSACPCGSGSKFKRCCGGPNN
jgi:hypothetical protein